MTTVVLSVTGSDRPGLTQALAQAVLSAGGNWLQSHLSRLGGLYVGSVLVELPDGNVDALLRAVGDQHAQGLDVRIVGARPDHEPSGETVRFSVVGQDRPGIVHQVTAVLSGLQVNIEDLDSSLTAEPHSGAPLFRMDARLRLPPGMAAERVQQALEGISAEIMVDVTVGAPGKS